jgi:hypothetical protein
MRCMLYGRQFNKCAVCKLTMDILLLTSAKQECDVLLQQQMHHQTANLYRTIIHLLKHSVQIICCSACSVLGQGLLPSLHAAAAQGLTAPGALAVPSSITVTGKLVSTALTQQVSGFDLSPVNKYKWHPTMQRVEHDRWVGRQA